LSDSSFLHKRQLRWPQAKRGLGECALVQPCFKRHMF
jgi:hypothetical protein